MARPRSPEARIVDTREAVGGGDLDLEHRGVGQRVGVDAEAPGNGASRRSVKPLLDRVARGAGRGHGQRAREVRDRDRVERGSEVAPEAPRTSRTVGVVWRGGGGFTGRERTNGGAFGSGVPLCSGSTSAWMVPAAQLQVALAAEVRPVHQPTQPRAQRNSC